jgi:site-specific recombinase XerD
VNPAKSDVDDEIRAEIAAFGRSLRSRNLSAKTSRAYLEAANLLAGFLAAEGRSSVPGDIGRADVEAFITDQLERWSASTAATRYRCLQQFFRYLVDVEVITESPMARMRPPAIPEAPVPVFTSEERVALLRACEGPGFNNRRDYAIVRLFLDSGMRLGELAGIRTEDVDLDAEVVYVTGKGNRPRFVPLNPKLMVAFDFYARERRRHRRAAEAWYWLGARGRLTDSGISTMLERRAEVAGVKGMHAHRFRHDFAHRWQAAGNSESDLQRLMGWRSPQMLARYGASAADERARDAYRRSELWEQL